MSSNSAAGASAQGGPSKKPDKDKKPDKEKPGPSKKPEKGENGEKEEKPFKFSHLEAGRYKFPSNLSIEEGSKLYNKVDSRRYLIHGRNSKLSRKDRNSGLTFRLLEEEALTMPGGCIQALDRNTPWFEELYGARLRAEMGTPAPAEAVASSSKEEISQDNKYPEISDTESSDESGDGGDYCYCHGPDKGHRMISCDGCSKWFHHRCVGVPKHAFALIAKFYCNQCKKPGKKTAYSIKCKWHLCFEPAVRLTDNKEAKLRFCSKAHQLEWAEWVVDQAIPDDDEKAKLPPHARALTQSELGMILRGARTHAKLQELGKKPTISTYLKPFEVTPAKKTEDFFLGLAEGKKPEGFLFITFDHLKRFVNGTDSAQAIKEEIIIEYMERTKGQYQGKLEWAFDYHSVLDEKQLETIKTAAETSATCPEFAAVYRKKLIVFGMVSDRADRIAADLRVLGLHKREICGSHDYTVGNYYEMKKFYDTDVWKKAVESGGFDYPPVDINTLNNETHDGTCLLGNKKTCPIHKFPDSNWREVKRDVAVGWAEHYDLERTKQIGYIKKELEISETRAAKELNKLEFAASKK